MSALNPVMLNAEFWLLWLVRQLLRGIAISLSISSALVALVLFWSVGAIESALETLQERSRAIGLSRNTKHLVTFKRGQ